MNVQKGPLQSGKAWLPTKRKQHVLTMWGQGTTLPFLHLMMALGSEKSAPDAQLK
jgi:hypothetical protein